MRMLFFSLTHLVFQFSRVTNYFLNWQIVNEVNNFDPYKMELSHESYRRELAKIPKDQELCAACFFRKIFYCHHDLRKGKLCYFLNQKHAPLILRKNPNLLLITQIIHHCQTIHQNAGTKCNLCNARFLKDSDLEFHRRYYHQQQQDAIVILTSTGMMVNRSR